MLLWLAEKKIDYLRIQLRVYKHTSQQSYGLFFLYNAILENIMC